MSEVIEGLRVRDITQGRPFRAFINHCAAPGDYIKIGNRVLLVIGTKADATTWFNRLEYIGEEEVRHLPADAEDILYEGEDGEGAEEWR